jgi:NADPH-dependent 2,4-dienoyl-CoA reductase/sulfur reductase-like enzyme
MKRVAIVSDGLSSGPSNGDSPVHVQEYDVIIVGAGFSGISALHRLRKAGLRAHIFEAGALIYPIHVMIPSFIR